MTGMPVGHEGGAGSSSMVLAATTRFATQALRAAVSCNLKRTFVGHRQAYTFSAAKYARNQNVTVHMQKDLNELHPERHTRFRPPLCSLTRRRSITSASLLHQQRRQHLQRRAATSLPRRQTAQCVALPKRAPPEHFLLSLRAKYCRGMPRTC